MSTVTEAPRPTARTARHVVRWLASFIAFPLGGLAAMLVVGRVDDTAAAMLGGLVTGAVLGVGQGLALGLGRRAFAWWVTGTALGLGLGLATGATLVGFRTGLGDLVLQGAIAGGMVGVAQAAVLWGAVGVIAAAWPAFLAVVWAIGWTVTTAVGVQVQNQFTAFGAAGALTVTALTIVLPVMLARRPALA